MNSTKAALIEELVVLLGEGNFVYGGALRSFLKGWKDNVEEVDIFTPTDKPTFKADYFRSLRNSGWVVDKIKSYVGHSLYNATKNGHSVVLDVRYGLDEKEAPFTEEMMHTDISNLKLTEDLAVKMIHGNKASELKKIIASAGKNECKVISYNKDIVENLKSEGYTITNEKEVKMSEKPKFVDMIKSDATNAAYRVAGTQITNGMKAAILKLLESRGADGGKLQMISEMLDTEVGSAVVALMVGFGLNYAPVIGEDPRVQKLATEFRTHGMATAGNAVVEVAMGSFLPVIQDALKALPAITEEKETTKSRVVENLPASSELDEEEEEETSKPKTVAA